MAENTLKEEVAKKLIDLLSPENVAKIVLGTDENGNQRSFMDLLNRKKRKKSKNDEDKYISSIKKRKKKKSKKNKKKKKKNKTKYGDRSIDF